MECYRREDPPPQPKLAVPISVAHHALLQGQLSPDPKQTAIGELICTAFYYLLRVGEYTHSPPKNRTRTQRFRVQDVFFRRADHSLIPNTAPLSELLTATHATLQISNQKNGRRGQCIHHHCTGVATSPVKALAHRVAHIMQHTTNPATALSTYYDLNQQPQQITAAHINAKIKELVSQLGLARFGYNRSNVSSHSLRAGGAMAMKLNGIDSVTIKKHGRWSSNTFMDYIHEQIGAFTVGLAARMSLYIPFRNVSTNQCNPKLTEPLDDPNTIPN